MLDHLVGSDESLKQRSMIGLIRPWALWTVERCDRLRQHFSLAGGVISMVTEPVMDMKMASKPALRPPIFANVPYQFSCPPIMVKLGG